MPFLQLLTLAKKGDAESIRTLMSRFKNIVIREVEAFRFQLSPNVSCQDICQDVWMRVWSRLPGFKGSHDDNIARAKFVHWVRLTTRNVARNSVNKMKARRRNPDLPMCCMGNIDVPTLEKTASSLLNGHELSAALNSMIGELEDAEAASILKMRFCEGMTLKAIAGSLDSSEDAIRYRLRKILNQLEWQVAPWVGA